LPSGQAEKSGPLIGIHPGSRSPARRWPSEYFADVANTLAQKWDARIVLTGGADEQETVQAVATCMQVPALNLAGRTSLGGLAALLKKFTLFISNDTGPAHMACAVQTASITLFGPADYQRWAPLDRSLHRALRRPVACSPCGYWECPIDHRCLRWLAPQAVLAVAERLNHEAT
ncbi:MAG TPA: glycosyltransferase family 9 protein, partial [Ktedonobacteraceae bacterium]|nr:glycosyltransferase family 9 protein [Ktedonobacteraceae bacterium]